MSTKTYAEGVATTAKSEAIAAAGTAADTKVSTHSDDTTNIHGIADTSALATKAYADAAVSTHQGDSTEVHGIANTALLATQDYVDTAVGNSAVDQSALAGVGLDYNSATDAFDIDSTVATTTHVSTEIGTHNSDTTSVHGIADTANLATKVYADTAVSTHQSDTTSVHGIADTSLLATTADVAAVTKTSLGLGNVDNTADASKPVSTAQSTAIATAKAEAIADATSQVNALLTGAPAALNTLDELAAALGDDANFASTVTTSLGLKAPLASPTFTGTVTLPAEGIVFSDGTQARAGVPSITTFGSSFAATGTLAAGEQDKFIPVAGTVVITLPASGYSTGQSIDFYQASGTGASFAATNSVVGTPGLKFRTTNSVVTAMKTSAGWLVFGDLSL